MTDPDSIFMSQALGLARRGLGATWPNPSVGAVLVRPGDPLEIIARGWTGRGGRPHGEIVALERAGGAARGATLYVTLEPCSHHGKTPPCADAVIAAGVARVVVAMADPDPRVSGGGLQRLKDAGIQVDLGLMAEEAREIALGHILRVTERRPMVTLKLAVGSDGLVPAGDGRPRWVTGEQARAHAHLLRARHDAVLVGRGTVTADDPELTCRLPGMSDRSPVRVVLDGRLRMAPSAKLLRSVSPDVPQPNSPDLPRRLSWPGLSRPSTVTSAESAAVDARDKPGPDDAEEGERSRGANQSPPVWIFCEQMAPEANEAALRTRGADIIRLSAGEGGRLPLDGVLASLAERGITRLLVEGGPTVARAFLDAELIDEAAIFRGSAAAGPDGLPPLAGDPIEKLTRSDRFTAMEAILLGNDTLQILRRTRPPVC